MSLESDEQWLGYHLPEAIGSFRLWTDTRALCRKAKRLALKERHGETLTAAYTEALRMSALLYLTHLGAAQDLTNLAIEESPDSTYQWRLKAKLDRLNALAVEPSEDA